MLFPRASRYTSIPRIGRMMMNSTQTVLATPPMSRLRKMSPKTHQRHMNHAKKMKNSNIASRNEPLSLNIEPPFERGASRSQNRAARPISAFR